MRPAKSTSIGVLLCLCIVLGALPQWAGIGSVRAADSGDQALVRSASDIFTATIDIQTQHDATDGSTSFTAVTTTVIKGNLTTPALVVIDVPQEAVLPTPGNEYLLFTRFIPETSRYLIVDSATGIVSTSDQAFVEKSLDYWRGVVAETGCAWTDIVVWNGTIYRHVDWNQEKHYVPREDVGRSIGTISERNTAATACDSGLADGTASEINAGAPVSRMKAYDPRFRIVVRKDDSHRYLYEAIARATAETGADLLDLRGTLIRAMLILPCNDDEGALSDCAYAGPRIENDSELALFVKLIQSASVVADAPVPMPGDVAQFELSFADGSMTWFWFDLGSGLLEQGIAVPMAGVCLLFPQTMDLASYCP